MIKAVREYFKVKDHINSLIYGDFGQHSYGKPIDIKTCLQALKNYKLIKNLIWQSAIIVTADGVPIPKKE